MMQPDPTTPHILVIDDSQFECRVLVDLFAESGFRVSSALSGTHGYHLAQTLHPHLIILDVHMPDIDGFACCRLLTASSATNDIPVIFVSGADSVEEKIEGLRAGAVDYVAKPFHSEELVTRVGVHLRKTRQAATAEPTETGPLSNDDVVLAAAQQLISDTLSELPGLSELAKRVGTYRERLNQLFNTRLGVSVFEYVRELRIERAIALLRESDMEIRDIASVVGFSNPSNFSTRFKERTGFTPKAYREAIGLSKGRTINNDNDNDSLTES